MSKIEKLGYTTNELAELVGLNPSRIRQLLIEDSELHGVKVGRDWFVPTAEAERWIKAREQKR